MDPAIAKSPPVGLWVSGQLRVLGLLHAVRSGACGFQQDAVPELRAEALHHMAPALTQRGGRPPRCLPAAGESRAGEGGGGGEGGE